MDILGGKVNILIGDVREKLRELPDDSVDCVVTSPPYWGLRDYGVSGQIGLEPTLGEHLAVMVEVFREVRRVLKPTGTMWLNYGDCYATSPNGRSAADTKEAGNDDRTFRDKPFSTIGAIYDPDGGAKGKGGGAGKNRYKDDQAIQAGRVVAGGILKPKDLCMIPNRLAIALQDDGWWVRSEIIWHKPNPMPESTRDRPTSSHEKIWLMTKRERYFYDADAIAEPTESPLRDILRATIIGRGTQDYSNASGANGRQPQQDNSGGFPVRDKDNPTRNSRNVWTIGTAAFSEAHFATFPPELAERCIKAGCPSDVCAKCGVPWVRDVEVESRPNAAVCNGKYDGVGKHRTVSGGVSNDARQRTYRGWKPSCSCESDTVSGSVLDPFGGAGTTGLVAASLGRTATLIELNPEYATLAQARIEAAFMGKEEGIRHMVKQLGKAEEPGPLFAGL